MSESDGRRGGKTRGRSARPRAKSAEPAARPKPKSGAVVPAADADLASEKLSRISGPASVAALFRRDADRAVRLYYSEAMKMTAGPFCARMAEMRRVYRLVTDEELARVAGTVHHGGIVAVAQGRPVHPFDSDAAEHWAETGAPLVALDGVGNPHNLGAIARTLAFFGFPRLLLSGRLAQAGLSDAAYRVAEGGLEFLEVYQTSHLSAALREIRDDYRVVGTALRSGRPLAALEADERPLCLVLGNEEEGLSAATLRACEAVVTIRGSGAVQSLNVSAAAAILVSQIAYSMGRTKSRIKPLPPTRPRRVPRRD